MTSRARSGSPHNKNHTDKNNSLPTHCHPCLPLVLISDHHNASLFPLLPSSPASRQRSLFTTFSSKDLHHALLPTYLGKHEVRTGFPEDPSSCSCQPCRRFHCLTCLARLVLHPGAGGPSALSPLAQTPHPSPGCREGCSLVFSSHYPADCAAGPSVDFHPFILGVAAMISRIVEYILDHTAGLSSFSLRYCCHSSDNSFHT